MLILPKAALIMSLQLSKFFAQVVKLRGLVQKDELPPRLQERLLLRAWLHRDSPACQSSLDFTLGGKTQKDLK